MKRRIGPLRPALTEYRRMTNDEKATLDKRLHELYATHNPGAPLQEIRVFEQNHAVSFQQDKYYPYTQQFDLYLSTLIEQLYAINFLAKPDWPDHRIVQFTLLVENLRTFSSAYDCLSKGAYEDALILMRPIYETIIRVVWMSCYPDDPYACIARNPDGRKFNLTNFIIAELKLDWWHEYKLLSAFSHSNSWTALESLIKHSQQESAPRIISMTLQVNDNLCSLNMNMLFYLFYCYFRVTRIVLTVEPKDKKEVDLWALANELEKLIAKIMKDHPNLSGRWALLLNDCDQLVELMRRADGGEDWKTAWNAIRES